MKTKHFVWTLAVALIGITATADAGIFKPGNRFIFGWRRPDASADEPPPDNPDQFVDASVVDSSPQDDKTAAVIEALAEENKTLAEENNGLKSDAVWAKVDAAQESESPGGIPGWILPSITGLAGAGLGLRSALGDKSGGS